ncbi:PD40 domain-containing protein [candidate division KSB1 bacterium]|nr:PD40 domain-containing protein [candidate division KSB1 bacterium]
MNPKKYENQNIWEGIMNVNKNKIFVVIISSIILTALVFCTRREESTGPTKFDSGPPLYVGGMHPSWSPDGTKIVFSSTRDDNNESETPNLEIYVMDADGSNIKRLTNSLRHDGSPSWSPDGSQIIFESDRNGSFEIYIMNADGSNQRQQVIR